MTVHKLSTSPQESPYKFYLLWSLIFLRTNKKNILQSRLYSFVKLYDEVFQWEWLTAFSR